MSVTSERLVAGAVATATRPAEPRVSVVVPVLNQARHLDLLLPAMPVVHEVILVDGGSVDDTVSTARRLLPDVRVIRQRRSGRRTALSAGFAEVTGDVVVTLGAGADPREIPRLVDALVGGADVATGCRVPADGRSSTTIVRRWANAVLGRVARRSFGRHLADLSCGFHAFWADLVPSVGLPHHRTARRDPALVWGDGPEIETVAVSCRLAAAGATIAEVPTGDAPTPEPGGIRAATDGFRVLSTLVAESRHLRGRDRCPPPVAPTPGPVLP